MTMRVRAVLMLMATVAMIGLASCGHYTCSATFGSSTCTAGPVSISQGASGGSASAYVFAVDEAGTIDGYTENTEAGTFAATASYTAPTIPANQQGYGMVSAQEQFLYAGFITTGQIFGWQIGSDGTLATISGSPFSAPYLVGIGSSTGEEDMIVNPAGTFLFVDDPSVEGIYVYSIGSGGVLTAVSGSPFSVPFFPGNMTTDGLGKYLYVATETNGSEIAAYSINGSSGALTPVVGSPFSYPMLQVQGDPTGNYLVGVEGGFTGDQHLYLFDIAQSGSNAGAITQVESVSTVYAPFSIAMQPNSGGNLVYTFSINSDETGYNPIEGYEISSGALTVLSNSPFSNVSDGSSGQFDQAGALLFPYSEVVTEGTNNVTITLGVDEVGSGGLLTQPISPVTFATLGFWTVTDAQ
jgi:hypothetical protein